MSKMIVIDLELLTRYNNGTHVEYEDIIVHNMLHVVESKLKETKGGLIKDESISAVHISGDKYAISCETDDGVKHAYSVTFKGTGQYLCGDEVIFTEVKL